MLGGSAEQVSWWKVTEVAPFPGIDCCPSFGWASHSAGSMRPHWTLASPRSRRSLVVSGQSCA
jgi:hypothetical protein